MPDIQGDFCGTARFRIKDILGTGGMGVVYRAEDAELGIDVALKTLPAPEPEQHYRLKQEFRSLADLKHPNLVDLYELFFQDDHSFFTMELLDGCDFAAFVHQGGRPLGDAWQARLRGALRQLASGMAILHASDRLHCDLKPSNVLVTEEGRVVLLDFGLARALAPDPTHHGAPFELAGTLVYMAPDEFFGIPVTPASDWYSVGVILYELIAGTPPFADKNAGEMLLLRGQKAPPRLRTLAADVPPWLDALTAALLAPAPDDRPKGAAIIAALDDSVDARSPASSASGAWSNGSMFVGRQRELRELERSLSTVEPGRPAIAYVSGASGIGKSELVHTFLRQVATRAGAVVLCGRCHPRESVPFKALDGVIDELSSYLLDCEEPGVAPPHAGELLQIFTVLRRVPHLETAPAPDAQVDAVTRRRWGIEALRALLQSISRQGPLVLWIDDLQWSDLDSLEILRALLRPPDAPGFLLVVSYRAEVAPKGTALAELADRPWDAPGAAIEIGLDPLSPEESLELGRHLFPNAAEEQLASIAREAQGSPFFVSELARDLRTERQPASSPFSAVVDRRLTALSAPGRRVLEIASVAAGPLSEQLVLRAAGLEGSARPLLATLERACLLKSTPRSGVRAVDAYHARIREAVLARLSVDALRERHRLLANALATEPDPDPEALLTHTLGAGDHAGAVVHAVRAAERAASALAFDRASDLYRRALELGVPSADRAAVLESLGECLINAGHGAQAPSYFFEAASADTVDPSTARSLRRRAAEQLIRNGQVDEGIEIFRHVLAEVGYVMPASSRQASLHLGLGLLRLVARGLDYQERSAAEIPAPTLQRLDALWGACSGLGVMAPSLASAIAVQHLREALDAGEPSRLACGLFHQAVLAAAIGGSFFHGRAARLLARGESLVSELADPTLRGFAAGTRGSIAWHQGRFNEASRSCDEAIAIFEDECRGAAWHRVATENYALSALAFLGDMRALSVRRLEALHRAEDRGDRFGTAIFRIGQLNLTRIADDEPERAIADAEAVTASWPLRTYHHTIITAQAELYRCDAVAASRRVEGAWPGIEGEGLLRLEFPRIELLHLRAGVALGVAAARRRGDAAGALAGLRVRALLLQAAAWARQIAWSGLAPAAPFSASIRAGVAWLSGDRARARSALSEAAAGFDAARMALYAEACRMALGAAFGAREQGAQAFERMRSLGVLRPERMAGMMLPAFPLEAHGNEDVLINQM